MANSTASSGTSGSSAEYWRRNLGSASSILYREAPLEYSLEVKCKCGTKAAPFISWSNRNPGMRYLKCARSRDGGCDFYRCLDGPRNGFMKHLLLDLRDAVKYWKQSTVVVEWSLEESRTLNARALDAAARENKRLQDHLNEARRHVAIIQGHLQNELEIKAELEGRIVKMQKERKLFFVVVVVFLGLVVVCWSLGTK